MHNLLFCENQEWELYRIFNDQHGKSVAEMFLLYVYSKSPKDHFNAKKMLSYQYRIPIIKIKSMGLCKKDVTPLLAHWSYIFLALIHQDGLTTVS